MNRKIQKTIALLISLVILLSVVPAISADSSTSATPGMVKPIWDMSKDAAVTAMTDGQLPDSVGPMYKGGGAGFTVRKDIAVNDIYGWVDWTASTAIDVSRTDAISAMLIDPEALGLIPGESYTWLIEGQRVNDAGAAAGNQRAAFGTVDEAGTTSIVGSPATMIGNNNTAVPGYFTIRISIVHSADVKAYSIYGVGSNNTTPAAGNLRVFNVSVVQRQEPATVYFNDFSDGTLGGVIKGTESQQIFEVIDSDASESGGKVLYISRQEGSGYAGFNLLRPEIDEKATADIPNGAIIRATVSMRLAPGSPEQLEPVNFRLVSGTNGVVVDWHAGQNLATLTEEFQAYPATATMAPGIGVFGVQLCMDNTGWMGFIEVDWIKIEIVEAPEDSSPASWEPNSSLPSLKDAYADYFTVGNVVDRVPSAEMSEMFTYQYNSITMENTMKPVYMSSKKGEYNFDIADSVMKWARDNGLETVGHCLAWHSQSADWLTMNPDKSPITYAEARENLEEFFTTVAGHFAGTIDRWDVLNELFHSGGGDDPLWYNNIRTDFTNGHPWRAAYANQAPEGVNPWDFVYDMFVFARKTDPGATLTYNDYNSATIRKARNIAGMANDLNLKWAKDTDNNPQAKDSYESIREYLDDGGRLLVETFGLQSHNGVSTRIWDTPDQTRDSLVNALAEFLKAEGVRINITELDVGAGSVTAHTPATQKTAYLNMFQLYMDNAHVLDRVTVWGASDIQSWLTTNATLFGRPTLRNNMFRAKPFFVELANQGVNYVPRGLTASFADGSKNATADPGSQVQFTINLGATGGLALNGTSTNAADYRLNGLPNSMSIVSATANSITVSGTLPEGTYKINPWVRKNSVITGSADDLNRVAGDWVGTRILDPLVITVGGGVVADDELVLTSDKNVLASAEYFRVYPAFTKEINSNTAILNFEFDTDVFEYRGFTPDEGVKEITASKTETGARIIVMVDKYDTKAYGEILLSVKEDLSSTEIKSSEVKVKAEYVVLADGEKKIRTASASKEFAIWDRPKQYTLIDLSNLIDLFGVKVGDDRWSEAMWYDIDNNGEIGIIDITYVAAKVV